MKYPATIKKMFCFIPVLMLAFQPASAQPAWESRKIIGNRVILQDATNPKQYYYGPGALHLSVLPDDRPEFQLVSMRYTGTVLTNDEADRHFTNLLMFGISMEALHADTRKEILADLPARATLSPLPIRHLESTLISGVGNTSESNTVLRKHISAQEETSTEPGVFWSKRNFTVPLDNHEAQILWDQVANGRLVISLNYGFYALVRKTNAESLEVSGDSVFVGQMQQANDLIQRDTEMVSERITGNALSISIDAGKYPELLKKLDINELSIPPAYAAFEVKCFDFNLGTRPDLAFKTIEIEGISIKGDPVKTRAKFSHKQTDISSRFVSFKHPVRLDKPIRYRVVETPFEGEVSTPAWQVMERFTNLIDASTPQSKNPLQRRCVDIEMLDQYWNNQDIAAVTVHFLYHFQGKQQIQSAAFSRETGAALETRCITFETDQPLQYMVSKTFANGKKTKGILRTVATDDYILLK